MKGLKNFLITVGLVLTCALNAQFPHVGVIASSGGVAAANMLTDGTFDSGTTYWDAETGAWTVTGGTASFDNTGTSALAQTDGNMQSSIQVSTAYTLNLDIIISSGNANIRVENADGSVQYTSAVNYTNGNGQDIQFTTPASISPGGIRIRGSITSTTNFDIDNLVLTAD